jgi:uncharacterized protein YrzB (UPF0473 family)
MEEKSLIDILFDNENEDNIILLDNQGNKTEFEQVAIIPIEEKCYAILHPAQKIEGIEEDEVLVFYIDEENETLTIAPEKEAIKVFEEYENLLSEEG